MMMRLRHSTTLSIAIILWAFLFTASESVAINIEEVVSTSPSWETFTNKDGSGLYHEILQKVFALYDIPVRHIYSKSSRSEDLVIENQADMMTCDDRATSPLVLARYPMYENDFYVFFNKKRIGPWKGIETLRGKEVLSQPTYYSQANFSVPVSIKDILTGRQALEMILMDRSDFYVDDLTLINQSIKEHSAPISKDDFDIKKIGQRSYHPLFNTTERGRAIHDMYDNGMIQLHKSGTLKPIYEKWGYRYPDFESY